MFASAFEKLAQRFRPAPKPLANSEDTTRVLLELFCGHGVRCKLKDGWICDDAGRFSAQMRVYVDQHPTKLSAQLDCEIKLPDGRHIVESCADIGDTAHEAIGNAIQNFCRSSFHVLFSALTGSSCTHCEQEVWEIGGRPRLVYVSPVTTRAIAGDDPVTRRWCEEIFRSIRKMDLKESIHWMRFFHGCWKGAPAPENEALLDNEPSPELARELAAFSWEGAPESRTLRLFIIVTDVPVKVEKPLSISK